MKSSFRTIVRLVTALFLAAFVIRMAASLQTAVSPAQNIQALNPSATSVFFSSGAFTVNENAGAATINVQISASPTTTATVEYLTLPGTAVENSDYTAAARTLTFPPNQQDAQSFTVIILNDNNFETNETVNLVLRNPVNSDLGTSVSVLTINDDDPAPAGTPFVFVDAYEPNDVIGQSFTTAADANKLCSISLWPRGDIDYFRFNGKVGSAYDIKTSALTAGLDTFMTVYDPQGNVIGQNDDAGVGDRRSEVSIMANVDGFYYARIVNNDPSDPINKTYCFEVDEVTPPTPTPTQTPMPGADACEFNSTLETACLIGVGQTLSLSFVPVYGSSQDTDYFRLWMKPGIQYTCETSNLSAVADTNMIFLDNNGNDFIPNLGNDDKEPGNLGSKLTYRSTYTGWLHILIGPVNPPPYEESYLHTYDLQCASTAATPTPTPTATRVYVPPPSGGPTAPTPTPFTFPTPLPTATPIDLSQFTTQQPQQPPVVQFSPLATATPATVAQTESTIDLTVYYDINEDFVPNDNEGIQDVAVALFDSATGQLIQFGTTNDMGAIRFESISTSAPVQIVVPYLNYSQVVVSGNTNTLLRVAPQPLPAAIP